MFSVRRFVVPEVIQTSKSDCGPAALKSMLEGFGIGVSYARLREVCQTDVDGTSVDRLEQIANELGLDAEQVVVPSDHVLLPHSHVLPAIVVVSNPAGATHLIVAWRTHGSRVQVMDPARGRLWMSRRAFVQQLYVHSTTVSAAAWREWAGSDEFLAPLRVRLSSLGLSRRDIETHIVRAMADPSWRGLAALDASIRLVATLRAAKALDRGDVSAALSAFSAGQGGGIVPDRCWSVRPAAPDSEGEPHVSLRGAVILRARGARASVGAAPAATPGRPSDDTPQPSPILSAVRLLGDDGYGSRMALGAALVIAVVGAAFEVVLLRRLLDPGVSLRVPDQRLTLMAAIAALALVLLGAEWLLATAERRLGSRLDERLRIALLKKLPRLNDRYFQTRPMSDMAERSHSVHNLRLLPSLGIRCLRTAMELAVTTAAIVWLAPSMALLAIAGAAATAAIPLLGHSVMAERDLRHRTHAGALARFHLDALLGRTAIDAHNAAVMLEREHEQLLGEWRSAGVALQRSTVAIEGLQMLVGFGVAAWLIASHFHQRADMSGMLLLVYWVLNVPALGYELALTLREYPAHRTTILRLLELLEGAEDPACKEGPRTATARDNIDRVDSVERSDRGDRAGAHLGVDLDFRAAAVVVSDQALLQDVNLHVPSGSHIAVVGPSGAGKSTLASVLLGWHPLAEGEVLVDGRPLVGHEIANLRRRTAWIDPTVQIWNRSLLDNLLYGVDAADRERSSDESIAATLEAAELLTVVTRLENGLATELGEGGTLLSAGEAQRVRLGRALQHTAPSLVLLDEPFRGLERERRRTLVARVRERWPHSTVLYVTHDIAEAFAFERVVVVDRGRIVEDGDPLLLSQRPSSRYRRMLHAHEALHARFTAGVEWRRITFADGRIVHQGADVPIEQTA